MPEKFAIENKKLSIQSNTIRTTPTVMVDTFNRHAFYKQPSTWKTDPCHLAGTSTNSPVIPTPHNFMNSMLIQHSVTLMHTTPHIIVSVPTKMNIFIHQHARGKLCFLCNSKHILPHHKKWEQTSGLPPMQKLFLRVNTYANYSLHANYLLHRRRQIANSHVCLNNISATKRTSC